MENQTWKVMLLTNWYLVCPVGVKSNKKIVFQYDYEFEAIVQQSDSRLCKTTTIQMQSV